MNKKIRTGVARAWKNSTFRTYMVTLLSVVAWWKVALALAFMLCLSVTQGVQLLLLVPLMQLVGLDVQQGSIGWLAQFTSSIFAALGTRPTLATILGAFVLLTTVLALVSYWQTVFNYRLQEDFKASLRQRLYRAIANADWLTLSRSRSSDFTHALTQELDRVGAATAIFLSLITSVLLVSIYVVAALQLSGVMTALATLSGAGLLLVLRKKSRAAQWNGEQISLVTNGLYSAAIEHLSGIKSTKSYGAEERSADVFSRLAGRVAQVQTNSIRLRAQTRFWFGVGSVSILCVILYFAVQFLNMTAASLLLMLFLFNRIVPLLNSVQQAYQECLNVLPAFAGVMEILKRCESVVEPRTERHERLALQDSIRFEAVSFAYGKEENAPAVRDLDLTIRAGKITAIVGPSGAGKSTVADLLIGLIVPDRGRVLVDALPLEAERIKSWRDDLGYVTQDTFLFHDTVRANLLWARPEATEDEIVHALELAAAEFVFELPEGMHTVLGDRGVRLSGGERQRLALARALLRKPSLLILDEATSALDSENERRIQDAIDKLHGQMTILVITHRLSTVRRADVIHVLEEGRLVEFGDWDTLLNTRDGRFRALCRAQGIEGNGESDSNGSASSRPGSGRSRVGRR
jgi:ATP-binding cassette subfamily C protein